MWYTVGRTTDRKLLTSSKLTIEKNEIILKMNCTSQKISEKSTQTKILITYHIDDLIALINNCKINPKVIGLLETRPRKNRQSLSNANLENYIYESTPTESCKGGTMLYVDKQLTYMLRKDPIMYKSKEIE